MASGAQEAHLLSFALAARLNGESDDEVYSFFKTNLRGTCSYEQARRAIEDSKQLQQSLAPQVMTVAMLKKVSQDFIDERERRRKEEELEWNYVPSIQPVASSSSNNLLDGSPQSDEETELGLVASQLPEGHFLVRTRMERMARPEERDREHSFKKGEVFVITQIAGNDDGAGDAWFCGYNLNDSRNQTKKWIFSDDVYKIF